MRRLLRKRILVPLGAVLILGATAGGIQMRNQMVLKEQLAIMKAAVVRDLNDPDSARFRDLELKSYEAPIFQRDGLAFVQEGGWRGFLDLISYDPTGLQLCGQINGKNKFGAYVGYKPFTAMPGLKKPLVFIAGDSDGGLER